MQTNKEKSTQSEENPISSFFKKVRRGVINGRLITALAVGTGAVAGESVIQNIAESTRPAFAQSAEQSAIRPPVLAAHIVGEGNWDEIIGVGVVVGSIFAAIVLTGRKD